jgi:hypothetical protein
MSAVGRSQGPAFRAVEQFALGTGLVRFDDHAFGDDEAGEGRRVPAS